MKVNGLPRAPPTQMETVDDPTTGPDIKIEPPRVVP